MSSAAKAWNDVAKDPSKLKEENRRLKDAVARLEEENQRLKNESKLVSSHGETDEDEIARLSSLPGIYQGPAGSSIGWVIRVITKVGKTIVTTNGPAAYFSPCFEGAIAGDIWAVKHSREDFNSGAIDQAILLQPLGRK